MEPLVDLEWLSVMCEDKILMAERFVTLVLNGFVTDNTSLRLLLRPDLINRLVMSNLSIYLIFLIAITTKKHPTLFILKVQGGG